MKLKKIWKKMIFIVIGFGLVAGGTIGYVTQEFNRPIAVATNSENSENEAIPEKAMNPIDPMNWQVYSPSNQRFNVQFPTNPVEGTQEMVISNQRFPYYHFSTEIKDSLYAVSYVDFPSRWKFLGANKLLTKSFEMFMQNEANVEEILQQEITYHNGLPALHYRVKQDGKEIQGKFIIAGNTLYRVAVTYPLAMVEEIRPQHFLESFQLNG